MRLALLTQTREAYRWVAEHVFSKVAVVKTLKNTFVGSDTASDGSSVDYDDDLQEARNLLRQEKPSLMRRTSRAFSEPPSWTGTVVFTLFLIISTSVRPEKPYNHLSTTLPLPLLNIFNTGSDYCLERMRVISNLWPLPEFIDVPTWRLPEGHFKGWAPHANTSVASEYLTHVPDWLPDPSPPGFYRWEEQRNITLGRNIADPEEEKDLDGELDRTCFGVTVENDNYSPVDDPMRITNLDQDILEPLRKSMADGSVKIKHLALIMMESMREEMFPIQAGTDYHKFITESLDQDQIDVVNERLSWISPNTEKITGKHGGFKDSSGKLYKEGSSEWHDHIAPGFGGVNVVGAFTPSSASTKSSAASHCGVWPMAVDMFDEADTQSYQPCITHILELFNQMKGINTEEKQDFREQEWSWKFFQAATETYDRQNIFNRKILLTNSIAKARLEDDRKAAWSDLAIPVGEEVGYMGFDETALRPYVKEFFQNVTTNNQRMFFSHFTSTTHHPWETPAWFNKTDYMGQGLTNPHEHFNNYLNAIRFHDAWLGELMQNLDDFGMANETLVVFVGDHGQAFEEDYVKTGTYNNAHVSNFRVPITFHHPHLPRVQYNANATSLSILPTILDLLVNTGSLNKQDSFAASDLVNEYEGQSLIRPYKPRDGDRRQWNYGVVNSGGGMLSITSADAPWRFVMPLNVDVAYSFTDLAHDPLELKPMSEWSFDDLAEAVDKDHGEEAGQWLREAILIADWWMLERKRLWGYHSEHH